jgi:hypothetical protein
MTAAPISLPVLSSLVSLNSPTSVSMLLASCNRHSSTSFQTHRPAALCRLRPPSLPKSPPSPECLAPQVAGQPAFLGIRPASNSTTIGRPRSACQYPSAQLPSFDRCIARPPPTRAQATGTVYINPHFQKSPLNYSLRAAAFSLSVLNWNGRSDKA